MMKLLVLLFLLTSWAHLGSEARDCDTGIAFSGHILNIAGSQKAKASADFVFAYNSSSLQGCLDDCCSGTYGWCSIATYRNQSTDANCLHFYCEPLSRCRFYPSISSDSFSFPATTLVEHNATENNQRLSNAQIAFRNAKSHTRSISARKGVDNVSISRKGVFVDVITIDSLSLKNDNTTVKPRKGVELFEEPTTEPTTSVIKPRKGVGNEGYIKERTSKIKPRKGVTLSAKIAPTPTIVSPVELLTSTVPYHERSEGVSIVSEGQQMSKDSELLSILENVFQEEIHNNDSSTKVPQVSKYSVPHASDGSTQSMGASILQSFDTPPYLQTSFPSTFTSVTSNYDVPHSTVSGIQSSSGFSSCSETYTNEWSAQQSASFLSSSATPSASLSSEHFIPIQPSPTTGYKVSENVKPSPTTTYFSKPTASIVPHEDELTNILKPHENLQVQSAAVTIETENERRYKSSMHLVISLVFGLMVLCAVLGAVAKRIYDVWMRRHYHRMDFLIDGLYDGYS